MGLRGKCGIAVFLVSDEARAARWQSQSTAETRPRRRYTAPLPPLGEPSGTVLALVK